jgi:hypothetical protein
MKVLINKCENGFSLSEAQQELFPGVPLEQIDRADARLIASFEAGDRRGNGGSSLEIVEIPEDARWVLTNWHGTETIHWTTGELNSY